jgi:hypothetical protein
MNTNPICICGHDMAVHYKGFTTCLHCPCTSFRSQLGNDRAASTSLMGVGVASEGADDALLVQYNAQRKCWGTSE